MKYHVTLRSLAEWLGIVRNQISHSEKVVLAIGASLGIGLTLLLSTSLMLQAHIGVTGSLLIMSSMGPLRSG